MGLIHKHDSELRDLWDRRSELDAVEWTRLYTVVWEILFPWRPSILGSLPEDRETYVNDFFKDKVFLPAFGANRKRTQADHAGALRRFYERYLISDVMRPQKRRQRFPENAESNNDREPETRDHESASISNERDSNSMVSRREGLPPWIHGSSDVVDSDSWVALRELTGKTVEEVAQSARTWLNESGETWIPIYLGLNHCPDAKESAPLYKLAKKYRVANHHHRAELLGITGDIGAGYGKTLIGRWLTEDLKITLEPENISAVHAALKILCLQALLWAEVQEKM